MTTQTDPPPVVHDKSIQTRSGLHPVAAPMKKLYLGQLDDFDEFVAAPQVDQITQTEAIFLVSDYYSSSLDEQRELTNLALLDPLEVACCFLELKKVVRRVLLLVPLRRGCGNASGADRPAARAHLERRSMRGEAASCSSSSSSSVSPSSPAP
eukprot:gene26197-32888_t